MAGYELRGAFVAQIPSGTYGNIALVSMLHAMEQQQKSSNPDITELLVAQNGKGYILSAFQSPDRKVVEKIVAFGHGSRIVAVRTMDDGQALVSTSDVIQEKPNGTSSTPSRSVHYTSIDEAIKALL